MSHILHQVGENKYQMFSTTTMNYISRPLTKEGMKKWIIKDIMYYVKTYPKAVFTKTGIYPYGKDVKPKTLIKGSMTPMQYADKIIKSQFENVRYNQ